MKHITVIILFSLFALHSRALPALTGIPITQIKLSMSNAFLIKSKKPILIGCGLSRRSEKKLSEALEKEGVPLKNISLVILTHGHSDHAGVAKEIRDQSKAKIIGGKGDLTMFREGHHPELKPTSLMARVVALFVGPNYSAFEPDIILGNEAFDLTPYGVSGQVISLPGHTPGALIVALNDKRFFVGDVILGGIWGGALFSRRPGEHYFHEDRMRNRENILKILKMGAETLYLGHGGPVERADVIEAFRVHLDGT